MIYREIAPSPLLQPFVQTFWTLTGHSAAAGFELILPDGRAELIVHRGDSFRQQLASGHTHRQPRALIAGQMESGVAVAPGAAVETIGVRFTPCGLASLCAIRQHELTDRLADIADAAGAALRRVVADAQCAATLAESMRLLRGGLERLCATAAPPEARVAAAVRAIVGTGGTVAMDRLHAALNTSPRWLERRFRASVGVSPKRLARIVRFQRALGALVATPRQPVAAVANDHGYYDQAHFTADFHAFTGHAPRQFVRERLDELTRAFVTATPVHG